MDAWLIDPADTPAIERYLIDAGLFPDSARPMTVARAGAGNMNLTLRVAGANRQTLIVKQGRPWVEKYAHIPAPFERTLVEADFYRAVAAHASVSRQMPRLLHVDERHHLIALEDIGAAGDCTTIYGGQPLASSTLADLLTWLSALAEVRLSPKDRHRFQNRAMRALNHEHIFDFPLRAANGLQLDAITPGLDDAARALKADSAYCERVLALGRRYLADGATLVHGDFFPGSWLPASGSIRVIDPEFCFCGDPEFDCGVLAAHLIFADAPPAHLETVAREVVARRLDPALVAGYAGVEIMRRLIGVAQLPLDADAVRKRGWLSKSRQLVLEPERGLL
jgi:5-methylthioribose kinase